MSENPTSDEIGEGPEADRKLEQDAERSADALDEAGYGGPSPENETGRSASGDEEPGSGDEESGGS